MKLDTRVSLSEAELTKTSLTLRNSVRNNTSNNKTKKPIKTTKITLKPKQALFSFHFEENMRNGVSIHGARLLC